MAALTQREKDYWISEIQTRLRQELSRIGGDNWERKIKGKARLNILKKKGMLEKYNEYKDLSSKIVELEKERERIKLEIIDVLHEQGRYSYSNIEAYIDSSSDFKDEFEKEKLLDENGPRVVELEKLLGTSRNMIMFATTSAEMADALNRFAQLSGIKIVE
jgi:hypothetical protein